MPNEEEMSSNEPQEAPASPAVEVQPEQPQAEPAPAGETDADGASPATPATTEPEASELIQGPDGRFETRVANPIRNEE